MSGYGFINLSKVPQRLFKKSDKGEIFLNIKVVRRKEVSEYGDTHFISCEPVKQEERIKDENYFIGALKEWKSKEPQTPEEVDELPQAESSDLPF